MLDASSCKLPLGSLPIGDFLPAGTEGKDAISMVRMPTHQQFVALSTFDSIEQRFGNSQLLKDEDCKPGLPINLSDALYVKNNHGQ